MDGNDRRGGMDRDGMDRLDQIIDQALESYTEREPRAGLEQRVLSRIAAAETERGGFRWGWKPVWALSAVVVLLAVVAIPVWFRMVQPETAMVHSPEIHRPAVAGVRPSLQAAPLAAHPARRTLASRGRVGIDETAMLEGAANAKPEPMERVNFAAIAEKPQANEPDTLKPIMLNPITIAPIQIRALN